MDGWMDREMDEIDEIFVSQKEGMSRYVIYPF